MPIDLLLVLLLSAGIIGFAVRRGGKPEMFGASIIALNLCVDLGVEYWVGLGGFSTFSISRFLIDLIELGLILFLALTANRVWPMFSAATQLLAVGGSVAVLGSDQGMQISYWAVTQLPLFGQLGALAIGTYLHMRRRAIVGPYRDWRIA